MMRAGWRPRNRAAVRRRRAGAAASALLARRRRRRGGRGQLDRPVIVERARVGILRGGAGDESETAAVELRVLLQKGAEALVLLQRRDQLWLLAEHDGLLLGKREDGDGHEE